MLLSKIRQETIKFASQFKKKWNNQENYLISEIQTIKSDPNLVQLIITDLIQDKKQELNELINNRLKGKVLDPVSIY